MTALATTNDLADRLPYVMDADELREAVGALDDLSDEARFYGKDAWSSPITTPQPVINLVLRAAKAHMLNYHGYVTSRAGDETVSWNDEAYTEPGRASFTKEERERIREYAGNYRSGFHSVNMFAASPRTAPNRSNLPIVGNLRYPEAPW